MKNTNSHISRPPAHQGAGHTGPATCPSEAQNVTVFKSRDHTMYQLSLTSTLNPCEGGVRSWSRTTPKQER